MHKARMDNVNWLSVREVAEMWAPELKRPASAIERELRIALYKLRHDYPFNTPINVNPDTIDLPSPETLIDRAFIERFHHKELWKLPEFWFKDLPTQPRRPGRPSVMGEIMQELQKRAQRYELADSLIEESRQLARWVQEAFPDQKVPKPDSIANRIGTAYHALLKDYPLRGH